MKGVPCGSQPFLDGGWHVPGRAASDSNEVSGASNGGLGHLKERSRAPQKLHSFPPHLGPNNTPVNGLEVAEQTPWPLEPPSPRGGFEGLGSRGLHPQLSRTESPGAQPGRLADAQDHGRGGTSLRRVALAAHRGSVCLCVRGADTPGMF